MEDCKLVYIDKDGIERGESYDNGDESSESLHSSGSFEPVSDDDYGFTVIDAPVITSDTSIGRDWEMPMGSSSREEVTSPSAGNKGSHVFIEAPESNDVESNSESKISKAISTTATIIDEQNGPLILGKLGEEKPAVVQEDENHGGPFVEQQLFPNSPPEQEELTNCSRPPLSQEEIEELPELMSKSAILGTEFVTQAEVKSLQTRNHAHVKKIKKLSELLDEEKKVSNELSEQVMKMTEENVKLLGSMKLVRLEKDQFIKETQKKLRRMKQMLEEKDLLIAKLTSSNESLRVQLTQGKEEQVLPPVQHMRQSRHYHDKSKHRQSHKSGGTARYEGSDRICDIGIDRSKKTVPEEYMYHRHREPAKERERHRNHHHYGNKTPQRSSAKQVESKYHDVDEVPSESQKECPVCNRVMPFNLTEREMTLHVESCLERQAYTSNQ